MKTRKQAITKAFSLLLALALFFGSFPMSVFAANPSEDPSTGQVWRVITEDRAEKEFPKKDDSVEWVTSDFEITNGKVVGFSSQGYEKFNSNPANVVVKIPSRDKDNMPVTIIGKSAFSYGGKFKHKMQFVEFPDTLTNIEEYAFYLQDLNFEEFTVPNTWKEVNIGAFGGAYFKKLILTSMNKDSKEIFWQYITTPYVEMNGMEEYTMNYKYFNNNEQGFFSDSNIKHVNYGNSKIVLNQACFLRTNRLTFEKKQVI